LSSSKDEDKDKIKTAGNFCDHEANPMGPLVFNLTPSEVKFASMRQGRTARPSGDMIAVS
jgi:hypothetical protein